MTYGDLVKIVDLAEKLLGTSLTIYYIGNCSSYFDASKPEKYPFNYDDRSWAVKFNSFRDFSNQSHYAPHNLILGATEEWKAMTQMELYDLMLRKLRQLRDLAKAA